MQQVMNCVPQLFGRIIKHVTACCHVWCMNKHMYHTDIHTHIIATALPRKKPAAKEEDDDLRELAAWAS